MQETNRASAVIIIPTYNERDNLAKLTQQILKLGAGLDILVVDDNSPDGTGKLADDLAMELPSVSVIHRAGKLGYGSAVIEGFRAAIKKEYAWILQMDADLSHDPSSIPAMLKAAEECDVVIGSRFIGGLRVVDWEVSRVLLSCFANRYAQTITGLPLHDITTGFRCYRGSVLRSFDFNRIKTNGYGFLIEMAYRLWKSGARLSEVPIIFYGRQRGKSKISNGMIFEAAFLVWRLRLSSVFARS
ncbi:MAG TPA: polyprenol monophosphomannose synthase [Candidatus Binatia bacterium]|nr:polyprenol monophosphomannose synthase [Candidatus Binatia bacterium]